MSVSRQTSYDPRADGRRRRVLLGLVALAALIGAAAGAIPTGIDAIKF